MKTSTKQQIEELRIANQKKLEQATQWFLNLKKGMPVLIHEPELNKQSIVFCENDVTNGELVIGGRRFNHQDGVLVNGVGRIWLNGSLGVDLFEATKHLIETTPIFMPKNTTPDLMQSITACLNKIFSDKE